MKSLKNKTLESFNGLMTVGGFPRSFLDTDLREARPRPRPED
jgi:hypothetical protein